MVGLVLVCSALLAAGPDEPTTPSAPEIKAYYDAKAQAGRDPDKQVQLALWCEAHGLHAERLVHLARAVLADPSHAAARGLMGLVPYQGRWERPEAVADRVEADAKLTAALAEYNAKRAKAKPNEADDQWALAVWCEQHDLKAEASAHFTAVTRLDPKREAAWKRLGYSKHNGRWMTDEQVAEQKAEAQAQKDADKYWEPLLTKWKGWLDKEETRAEAEAALADVVAPRAVPSIVKVFGKSRPTWAVQLLGQIDAPSASRVLAGLAIFGKPEVRRIATETLKHRDPREFAGPLIALLRDPIKYEVRPVGGPGSPGVLLVEGKRFDVKRLYSPPTVPMVQPGDQIRYDSNGLPVAVRTLGYTQTGWFQLSASALGPNLGNGIDQSPLGRLMTGNGFRAGSHALSERQQLALGVLANSAFDDGQGGNVLNQMMMTPAMNGVFGPPTPSSHFNIIRPRQAAIPVGRMEIEAQRAARVAEHQMESDVAALDAYNAPIKEMNSRAVQVLNEVTAQNLPEERPVWQAWWVDQLGYNATANRATYRPVIEEQVPLAYQPQMPIPVFNGPPAAIQRISCFGAGTLVRTLSGPRPIEDIQVGDRLLTRDTESGALSYQPVLVVHHNPPSKTLRIILENEAIVSSVFHRFWRAGKGWAMARDLQPGDVLRTLSGQARVVSIEEDQVQPVFNLDVAENQTFFVGQEGALVHDNTVPSPRDRRFDVPPTLVSRQGD